MVSLGVQGLPLIQGGPPPPPPFIVAPPIEKIDFTGSKDQISSHLPLPLFIKKKEEGMTKFTFEDNPGPPLTRGECMFTVCEVNVNTVIMHY